MITAKEAKDLTIQKLTKIIGEVIINMIDSEIREAIQEEKTQVVIYLENLSIPTSKLKQLYEMLGYYCETLYSQLEHRYNRMLLSWER